MFIRAAETTSAVRALVEKELGLPPDKHVMLLLRGRHLKDMDVTLAEAGVQDGNRIVITLPRTQQPVLTPVQEKAYKSKLRAFVGSVLFGAGPSLTAGTCTIEDYRWSQGYYILGNLLNTEMRRRILVAFDAYAQSLAAEARLLRDLEQEQAAVVQQCQKKLRKRAKKVAKRRAEVEAAEKALEEAQRQHHAVQGMDAEDRLAERVRSNQAAADSAEPVSAAGQGSAAATDDAGHVASAATRGDRAVVLTPQADLAAAAAGAAAAAAARRETRARRGPGQATKATTKATPQASTTRTVAKGKASPKATTKTVHAGQRRGSAGRLPQGTPKAAAPTHTRAKPKAAVKSKPKSKAPAPASARAGAKPRPARAPRANPAQTAPPLVPAPAGGAAWGGAALVAQQEAKQAAAAAASASTAAATPAPARAAATAPLTSTSTMNGAAAPPSSAAVPRGSHSSVQRGGGSESGVPDAAHPAWLLAAAPTQDVQGTGGRSLFGATAFAPRASPRAEVDAATPQPAPARAAGRTGAGGGGVAVFEPWRGALPPPLPAPSRAVSAPFGLPEPPRAAVAGAGSPSPTRGGSAGGLHGVVGPPRPQRSVSYHPQTYGGGSHAAGAGLGLWGGSWGVVGLDSSRGTAGGLPSGLPGFASPGWQGQRAPTGAGGGDSSGGNAVPSSTRFTSGADRDAGTFAGGFPPPASRPRGGDGAVGAPGQAPPHVWGSGLLAAGASGTGPTAVDGGADGATQQAGRWPAGHAVAREGSESHGARRQAGVLALSGGGDASRVAGVDLSFLQT